jgi:hypothetical protein
MKRLATFISRLFDPFIMLAVVFIVHTYRIPIFLYTFLTMVILPLALYVIAWKTKVVSNWDITNRTERPKILWPMVLIECICLFVFRLWIIIPVLVAITGLAIITHWWKISGHAMASAFTAGTLVMTYGWSWWPVLLIPLIVSWARVVRRDHTVTQVVAGMTYSLGILIGSRVMFHVS